jgi:hypothetical protein
MFPKNLLSESLFILNKLDDFVPLTRPRHLNQIVEFLSFRGVDADRSTIGKLSLNPRQRAGCAVTRPSSRRSAI